MSERLVVLRGVSEVPAELAGAEEIIFSELRSQLVGRTARRWVWRYVRADMVVPDLLLMTNPFKSGVVLRLVGRRRGTLSDMEGRSAEVTWTWLAGRAIRAGRDLLRSRSMLRHVRHELAEFAMPDRRRGLARSQRSGLVVYLRSDLWAGVTAGGSVAHTAGVVSGLRRLGMEPVVLSTVPTPVVDREVEAHRLPPPDAFWDVREATYLAANRVLFEEARAAIGHRRPTFIYQRYALGSYVGLKLAKTYGTPFVFEFNGSEVWIARHWGEGALHREDLFAEVERVNLSAADLVVVVSDPMAAQASELGAHEERILVAPNGVDPGVYRPDLDGSAVRLRYGLGDRTVIGFIGTFGAWHGAEVLAEAFGRLVERRPDLRKDVVLLMVGDGSRMPLVREAIRRLRVEHLVILTGSVPQTDGPAHLAACDVLASPHVPNPDGTPFFGSPTKLFEYMGMGRAIVASDLDQIGEVLRHGETGWLVQPGDAEALASGLEVLVDQPALRRRLGAGARASAEAEHTWVAHTRKILEALVSCGA